MNTTRFYGLKCDKCGKTDNSTFTHFGDVCLAMEKGGWQVIRTGNTFMTLCKNCKGVKNDENTIQVSGTSDRTRDKKSGNNDTGSVWNRKKPNVNTNSTRKRKANADNNTKKHN